MYDALKNLHSYWAYFVLLMVFIALAGSVYGYFSKKEFTDRSLRIALFALIVSHIQLVIGLILYFVSPMFDLWSSLGGEVMKNASARLLLVEHPLVNILAIVLITIGFSKHKKKNDDASRYKTIMIFYGIAVLLLLSRIPWDVWPR